MARKKRSKRSESSVVDLYDQLTAIAKEWGEKENAGMQVLEAFQKAQTNASSSSNRALSETATQGLGDFDGHSGGIMADPWVQEDLYVQIKDLHTDFAQLLDDMYNLQDQARKCLSAPEPDSQVGNGKEYYLQMSQDVASHEASFQHIEGIINIIDFDTPSEELQTLILSWSTSPFRHSTQSKRFQKLHGISREEQLTT